MDSSSTFASPSKILKREEFDNIFIKYVENKKNLRELYYFACLLVGQPIDLPQKSNYYTQELYQKDKSYISQRQQDDKYKQLFTSLYNNFLTPELIKNKDYAILLEEILDHLKLKKPRQEGGSELSAGWSKIIEKIFGDKNYLKNTSNINIEEINGDNSKQSPTTPATNVSFTNFTQKIFFGAPGTGKSSKIKELTHEDDSLEYAQHVFRTTFHPEYDYASFVGSYKPQIGEENEPLITYKFESQVFADVYVASWSSLANNDDMPYWLVIEEINRGNCAQIFGDLFQLLDRYDSNSEDGKVGFSKYPIKAHKDFAKWLETNKQYPKDYSYLPKDGTLCLPPNLNIVATMNTSDQSLFPMDSAFKRRWSWEYVPINTSEKDNKAAEYIINIGRKKYKWISFLKQVNPKIRELTKSEDKQLGTYFITGNISEEEFISKVIFYLWSDICKDEYKGNRDNFMRSTLYKSSDDRESDEFTFNELFENIDKSGMLQGFMTYLNVEPIEDNENGKNTFDNE